MRNNRVKVLNFIMLFINIFAVLAITVFIYITTKRICSFYIARDFMNHIVALPGSPLQQIYYSIILTGCFVLTFVIREIIFTENNTVIYSTLILDFFLSFLLVLVLNFNYNGILLYVFANIVSHIKGNRGRYLLMFLAITSFLIADYQLISISTPLYSINDYINFYNAAIQQYLMVSYNLLVSVNIVMFIIYCILIIQSQRATIEEVNRLSGRLSQANEDLENANLQLQEYAVTTEKLGETRERNRLAREIHDTLGHTLTGISAGLDACITTLEIEPAETKKRLEYLADVTRQGITDVRQSVRELRPDSLQKLNLEYAIQNMITNITQTTDTKIFFHSDLKNLKFDEDEENALYRIIQEGLTNAIRHGKPTKIWITLEKEGSELTLIMKDNGVGAKEIVNGFGTRHIMERVEILHGTVSFDGSEGFVIDARIPIRWGEDYDSSIDS